MPRTICTEVFQYDELSPMAQEKAREWFRESSAGDNFFSESVIEDAADIADILGIDLRQRRVRLKDGSHRYEPAIQWSGFWSQGDGASFTGTYRYAKGASSKIRAYAPNDTELHRIADALQALQKPLFYGVFARISVSGRYSHSHTMRAECECNGSDDIPDGEFLQCFRDFADWIYGQLKTEFEYQNADAQVIESIRANEYEFTAEGARA